MYSQIKNTILLHREITERTRNQTYRLNRSMAIQYFDIHKKWKEKIKEKVNLFKSNNQKIVHVDICGEASGFSLGFDESYCFCLSNASKSMKELFRSIYNQTIIEGDIFNSEQFSSFLNVIKNKNVQLVTFEPVAGLHSYGLEANKSSIPLYKEITNFILAKRLVSLVKILKPGSMIYLERPFQFDADSMASFLMGEKQNMFPISLKMKKLARKMKCKIEIHPEIGGPYFLLTKRV